MTKRILMPCISCLAGGDLDQGARISAMVAYALPRLYARFFKAMLPNEEAKTAFSKWDQEATTARLRLPPSQVYRIVGSSASLPIGGK